MSATGRGRAREPGDLYETPAWCVHRLLDVIHLKGGPWLEPGAGSGSIIRAVNSRNDRSIIWTAVERNPEHANALCAHATTIHTADFLTWEPNFRYEVVIGNPPYSQAMEFVQKALACAITVVFLLRLNFLAGERRAAWLRANTPDVYVLPNRPSFVGGRTDATEYAWMVWPKWDARKAKLELLDSTPKHERRAP